MRIRRATRSVLFSGTSWRYGLRLALCIGLAQALTSLVSLDRSYWVALTVTFVLKPDFGSVFSRAVLRAVGTAAGLVIAAPVLAEVPIGWWDVPVMVLLAPLIPALAVKGYAFQTAAITPVILLLSDLLNHRGVALVQPRLVDSLIGCVIVLVAGYLLWPESWHTRIGHRIADTVTDLADYVGSAFGTTGDGGGVTRPDQAERARARRRIHRDLSSIRAEFQRALTEPPPVGTRAAAWLPLVVAIERIVDATTAARVRVNHGAPEPAPAEVAEIRQQLRELAERLRATEVLVGVRTELPGDEEGCWRRCARRWRRHARSPHHSRRGPRERGRSGCRCRVPAEACGPPRAATARPCPAQAGWSPGPRPCRRSISRRSRLVGRPVPRSRTGTWITASRGGGADCCRRSTPRPPEGRPASSRCATPPRSGPGRRAGAVPRPPRAGSARAWPGRR